MNIVYLGSGGFGLQCLKAVADSTHQIVMVFTRPDKRTGRGQKVIENPIRLWCDQNGIECVQLARLNEKAEASVRRVKPDLMLVVSYGEILKESLFSIPRLKTINMHSSLLPHLRGPAPVEWALALGARVTGMSVQYLEKAVDSGDILDRYEISVDPADTAITLWEKMLDACGPFLVNVLNRLERGEIKAVPQDPQKITFCPLIKKEDGHVNWQTDALEIINRFRAFIIWPGTFCRFRNKRLKLSDLNRSPLNINGTPGEILSVEKEQLTVACGKGSIGIQSVQPENKQIMSVRDFINGYHPRIGEHLD